jgi:hypothetical protein
MVSGTPALMTLMLPPSLPLHHTTRRASHGCLRIAMSTSQITDIKTFAGQDSSSPVGIMLGSLAQLPGAVYKIVQFESGDTYKKIERIEAVLRELYDDVEHMRGQTYHLMATVVRQQGVNYDEPVMVCYLKPVFSDKPIANWMIKTSENGNGSPVHLVLNKQKVSAELADYATAAASPVEMIAVGELERLTGMKPGGVNFLLKERDYNRSFMVSLLQPEMIHMRPGETEYLSAKIEHNLDTAIIEVPLGEAGHSVMLDGSTFFWILTEIQRKYPQIKFLKNEGLNACALRYELAHIAKSLSEGLSAFTFNDQIPLLNYFNSLEKYLEHYIRVNHSTLQSDTISVFIKEFIRNFLAVEGKMLYAMIDMVLEEDLGVEEKLRALLYQFYRKFARTEFAKNISPPGFDLFIQQVCVELCDHGLANAFIVNMLLQDEKGRNRLARHLPKKMSLDEVLRQDEEQAVNTILRLIADGSNTRARRSYQKYVFSEETVKAEKYFALHAQIVDLLPQFIARSESKHSHPLLVFEAIQKDMIRFFYQRRNEFGISAATIANISKIFIRICFGKQIQLLDVIEDKLFLCGVSVRSQSGMTGRIAPDLARTVDQDRYVVLQERRQHYMEHLLARFNAAQADQADTVQPSRNEVSSLLLSDLENFLNLPMMRELFASREALYKRLTNVADFRAA